jgi:hypothetical protein
MPLLPQVGAAAGRDGRQVGRRDFLHGGRLRTPTTAAWARRTSVTTSPPVWSTAQPHRPGVGDVQMGSALRDAHLARSGQGSTASQLMPVGRDRADRGAERPGLGRPARRAAGHIGPADQRDHHRAQRAADARAVPRSCCAVNADGAVCASATWRASSSAPRATRAAAASTASRRRHGVSLASGANALAGGRRVRAKLELCSPSSRTGLRYDIAYDTTPVRAHLDPRGGARRWSRRWCWCSW